MGLSDLFFHNMKICWAILLGEHLMLLFFRSFLLNGVVLLMSFFSLLPKLVIRLWRAK